MTRAGLAAVYAVFAVYAAIVLLTSPGDALNTFATDWLYQALIAAAAVIAAARAIHVEQDRLAWSVIAAALASTSIAELFFIAVEPDGYPSVSDLFWIAFYPLAYIGMVLLLRRRARAIARPLWLDGLTASVAAAALGAAVLLEVVLSTAEGSRAEVATNLAYPLGDVLLLSAVFGVFSLAGWRIEGRWLLLGLGLLATAVADGVYLFTVDTYQAGRRSTCSGRSPRSSSRRRPGCGRTTSRSCARTADRSSPCPRSAPSLRSRSSCTTISPV